MAQGSMIERFQWISLYLQLGYGQENTLETACWSQCDGAKLFIRFFLHTIIISCGLD